MSILRGDCRQLSSCCPHECPHGVWERQEHGGPRYNPRVKLDIPDDDMPLLVRALEHYAARFASRPQVARPAARFGDPGGLASATFTL